MIQSEYENEFGLVFARITAAAENGSYLSYRDAGDRKMYGPKLFKALEWSLFEANKRGLPAITSIVVNDPRTGKMTPSSFSGFIASAKRAGYLVDNPDQFLAEQQRATFALFSG